MKTITTITAIILCLVFATKSQADYATGQNTASATTQQTLTLIILPAIESTEFASKKTETATDITLVKTIGVRANTPWSVNVQPLSYGFVEAAQCSSHDATGLSNGDAGVGNAFQLFTISCVQPKSWADNNINYFNVTVNVSGNAGF